MLLTPFTYVLGMRQNSVTSGFNGWSGAGCQGTGPCLIRMNSNQTVTAYYGSEYPPEEPKNAPAPPRNLRIIIGE